MRTCDCIVAVVCMLLYCDNDTHTSYCIVTVVCIHVTVLCKWYAYMLLYCDSGMHTCYCDSDMHTCYCDSDMHTCYCIVTVVREKKWKYCTTLKPRNGQICVSSSNRQYRLRGPVSHSMGSGAHFLVWCGRGVILTTHLHLAPLRISGTIHVHLHPLHAFMEWIGKLYPFLSTLLNTSSLSVCSQLQFRN
jgi:hypothetical protein